MAQLHRTAAALRIMGDKIDPDEVSATLGCKPTRGWRKGQTFCSPSTGREYTRKNGIWLLDSEDQTPGNLDEQIRSIFDILPADVSLWEALSSRFKIDVSLGCFMKETSEGIEISPATLKYLGDRGILLGLSIYAPLSDEADETTT